MQQARMARFIAGLAGVGQISVALAAVCAAVPAIYATDASAQIQAAQRQFNAGNYSGAIATLQAAVSQNPNSAEAYYWLGRSYYEIHDYDNAITAAEKSVAIDDKNSVVPSVARHDLWRESRPRPQLFIREKGKERIRASGAAESLKRCGAP